MVLLVFLLSVSPFGSPPPVKEKHQRKLMQNSAVFYDAIRTLSKDPLLHLRFICFEPFFFIILFLFLEILCLSTLSKHDSSKTNARIGGKLASAVRPRAGRVAETETSHLTRARTPRFRMGE